MAQFTIATAFSGSKAFPAATMAPATASSWPTPISGALVGGSGFTVVGARCR